MGRIAEDILVVTAFHHRVTIEVASKDTLDSGSVEQRSHITTRVDIDSVEAFDRNSKVLVAGIELVVGPKAGYIEAIASIMDSLLVAPKVEVFAVGTEELVAAVVVIVAVAEE